MLNLHPIVLLVLCLLIDGRFLFGVNGTYEVSKLTYQYGTKNEKLPSLSELDSVTLKLFASDQSVSLREFGEGLAIPLLLDNRDLHLLGEVPLQYLKSLGFEGLVVLPDPRQINPINGEDLREEGNRELDLLVWVSLLQDVRMENDGAAIRPGHLKRLVGSLDQRMGEKKWLENPLREEFFQFADLLGSGPGRRASVLLGPGDSPGFVNALIKIKSQPRNLVSFSATNSGTPSTGEWLLSGSLTRNQFTGSDDRLLLSHQSTETGERQAWSLAYEGSLLVPQTLLWGFSVGSSSYDGSSFAVTRIDFEGQTDSFDLFLRWNPPGWTARDRSLFFEIGALAERTSSSNSLSAEEAEADLFTPRVSVGFSSSGSYRNAQGKLSLSGNRNSIPSSTQFLLGGFNVVDRFLRLRLEYLESLQIGKWMKDHFFGEESLFPSDHLLVNRMKFDYGLEKVRHLPQHQFISGGSGSVRGYPESPAAGDNGYLLSSEYRIPLEVGLPGRSTAGMRATLIPFVDWSETFVNDPANWEADQAMLGAGVGMEIKMPQGFFARIDWAKPMREMISGTGEALPGTQPSDHRVHAMVRWDF